jgi:hypothetical protein
MLTRSRQVKSGRGGYMVGALTTDYHVQQPEELFARLLRQVVG